MQQIYQEHKDRILVVADVRDQLSVLG